MKNNYVTKIINLLKNYGLMLGCYVLFFIFLSLLTSIWPNFSLDQYQQSDLQELMENSPLQFFILAVIIAPVIEEGMFRSIIRPTPGELIFFLSSWLIVVTALILPDDLHWLVRIVFLGLLFLMLYLFLNELITQTWKLRLCRFLKKHYLIIWIITAVIFGLVHVLNYVDSFELNVALLLLVFPRIIAGAFFGKVKIENGSLIWPIALHAMNNGAVVFFLLLRLL